MLAFRLSSSPVALQRYGHLHLWVGRWSPANGYSFSGAQMPINKSANWQDAYGRPHEAEWYSYDHGPVHFTTMSTEIDFSPGSAQYQCASAEKKCRRAELPLLP